MDYSKLATFDFLFSLGYVTLGASLITMIFTEIIKLILKKTKVLTPNIDTTKKDIVLSRVGRIVALVVYACFYIVDVLFIKKTTLEVDITLFTSLISGSTLTLIISKGIYTGIRQISKKKNVFDKLEVAQKTIFKLQKELKASWEENVPTAEEDIPSVEIREDSFNNNQQETPLNKKWIIKGE